MAGEGAAGATDARSASRALIDAVAALLLDHHLPPTPDNYAFAYDVVCNPEGRNAKAVARLADGGIRLTPADVEGLGGGGKTFVTPPADAAVLAETADQVDSFSTLVDAMRGDAEDFGNDLAAGTDAMRRTRDTDGVDRMIDMAGAMVKRVRHAERRLEAATIETRELRAKLQQARDNARRDPLTGLPNRRALEETYAAAVATGERLCLAMCDVDSFKAFNDSHGHLIGDRVLKAIAATLADHCAEHLVVRYGGEEFAVLFSGLALDEAIAILDEARCVLAAKRYRLRENNAPLGEVTFSSGITAAGPGEIFSALFARADSLLYAAKADGRNRIKAG